MAPPEAMRPPEASHLGEGPLPPPVHSSAAADPPQQRWRFLWAFLVPVLPCPRLLLCFDSTLLPNRHQGCTGGVGSGGEVKHQGLLRARSHHDRRAGQVSLEILECLVGLFSPFKGPLFLPQLGDEASQCCHAPSELLHFFESLWRAHVLDRLDLFRVSLDASVGHEETQELARGDSEHTLLWVEP